MNWKSKTPQCSTSALYLDALLKLDTNGKMTTQLYEKRDDFNLSIVNFPYLHVCSNIPASPAYRSLFDMQELLRQTISLLFSSRLYTDKQVDVTGISTVSFTGSFPQILWSLQQFYLPIQPFFGPHAVWYVLYQSLSRS
jgi:hypothetical protein